MLIVLGGTKKLSPKVHHAAIVQLSYGTPVVSSFLWGTPFPKGGLIILGKMCPGEAKIPRKNCPGGQIFWGTKFPPTPEVK